VLAYGAGPDQVADVYLPAAAHREAGAGPPAAPLALCLHGGFWRAEYDRRHAAPLAEALAAAGFVACIPEYRRTGQPGGGWPGTFDDVAAAADLLPGLIARETGWRPDGGTVLAGHSAGGQLALWAASRHHLPGGSAWRSAPVLRGVVALAAVSDLAQCFQLRLDQDAAAALLGGGPAQFPERYRRTDPAGLVPSAAPCWLIHGIADDRVPVAMSARYAVTARDAGATVHLLLLADTGHFELIDPLSGAWPRVLAAFREAAGSPAAG
jgi:acetyl esterase/lipase